MTNKATTITYKNLQSIGGWLAATDYEIFKQLLTFQVQSNVQGAVAEIGVHHGKSFVPLAAFSGDARLYAIDVFGDQARNIDQSGKGDRDIFIKNLRDFSIDMTRVVIDERMSSDVTAEEMRVAVGEIKFFHIDGGHHFDAVIDDVKLAADVLADGGVIAVDDVFRPEWPEVSMAMFRSREFVEREIVLFAIGFNKSYFCRRERAEIYQNALIGSQFLAAHLTRTYQPRQEKILVFQRYPLPEWSARQLLYWVMSVYSPYLYVSFRQSVGGLKRLLGR